MRSFKTICILACSFLFVLATFFLHQGIGHAELKPIQPPAQRQMQIKEPVSVTPNLKLCPDLKVSLNVAKNSSGLVTLNGTITNIGNKDYDIPSEAHYFMNLSYPPKTYNQVGVSEQLCTKAFTQLKKGASFPINCTYQIPNFDGWVQDIITPPAKRLFTLRVVKKDMSSFTTGEDCDPINNSMGVEVGYKEKHH